MSYKEFKVWVELHPEEREELESPVTVVRRVEQAAQYPVPLEVTPYSQEYTQFLAPAANHLLQVSRNSLSPSFLFFVILKFLKPAPGRQPDHQPLPGQVPGLQGRGLPQQQLCRV